MGYTFRPEGGGEVMPWKERSVMNERMRFVIRLKDGELCQRSDGCADDECLSGTGRRHPESVKGAQGQQVRVEHDAQYAVALSRSSVRFGNPVRDRVRSRTQAQCPICDCRDT